MSEQRTSNLVAELRPYCHCEVVPGVKCVPCRAADEIKRLTAELARIDQHNSAKAQVLHEAYQAGMLDSNEYLKKRAYRLLGGRLPDETSSVHEHEWKNIVWRVGELGPERLDICKCGMYRIRTAENG